MGKLLECDLCVKVADWFGPFRPPANVLRLIALNISGISFLLKNL